MTFFSLSYFLDGKGVFVCLHFGTIGYKTWGVFCIEHPILELGNCVQQFLSMNNLWQEGKKDWKSSSLKDVIFEWISTKNLD